MVNEKIHVLHNFISYLSHIETEPLWVSHLSPSVHILKTYGMFASLVCKRNDARNSYSSEDSKYSLQEKKASIFRSSFSEDHWKNLSPCQTQCNTQAIQAQYYRPYSFNELLSRISVVYCKLLHILYQIYCDYARNITQLVQLEKCI